MQRRGDLTRGERSRPARLIVADDHELARAGLCTMLAGEPDLEVVGEAECGREAAALCARLRPDLVLMDVRMPALDGLEATAAIKAEHPEIAVLVVTMYEDPDYLFRAVQAGAAGYVLKDATRREFLTAVRRVLGGEEVLDPALATQLLRKLGRADEPEQGAGPAGRFTPRELDVLRLLVEGRTNKEIAAELGISRATVKAHVEHIIPKLGASDRTQAAVRAVRLGLVSSTP